MNKRTSGPWLVHEEGRIGKSGPAPAFIEVRAGERVTVCTVFPHAGVGGAGVPAARANAALISAAPELLEALKRLVFDCKADGLQHKAGFDCWIAAADDAIAKAEGVEAGGEQGLRPSSDGAHHD